MASTIKKLKRVNTDDCIAAGRSCRISDKHYRPYHYCLQKRERLFDNDWMDYYSVEGDVSIEWETGINKEKWRAHDTDGFDDYKDDD